MPDTCRRCVSAFAVRVLQMVLSILLALTTPSASAFDASMLKAAAHRLGPAAEAAMVPLQTLVAKASRLEETERLVIVNKFFNERIAFATDLIVWGQEDYWATPLEMLSRGRGDCEDYAIAKYAVLLAAGTPASKVRLVYVYANIDPPGSSVRSAPVAHMVLAYQADGDDEAMILDNLHADVQPASQRSDLQPLFSFREDGLWLGTGPIRAGNPMVRLARWREVVQKMRVEGW
jgi:predicted transglutaminase-like cysteine proteinase